MTKDEKNALAYDDCSKYQDASMPHDEEYMASYRFWRCIAMYPEDSYMEHDAAP